MAFFSPALPVRRLCFAVVGAVALQSLSLVHGVLPASAQASQPASEPNRPAYQIGSAGRFNEDWSVLRGVDLGATDDFWDRLKFIPLTPDQSVWELRLSHWTGDLPTLTIHFGWSYRRFQQIFGGPPFFRRLA